MDKEMYQPASNLENLELELKKSMQELVDIKFALDESSIVAITDSRGIITYVNDQFCSYLEIFQRRTAGSRSSNCEF